MKVTLKCAYNGFTSTVVLPKEEHGQEELGQEHVGEDHVPLDVLEPNLSPRHMSKLASFVA